MNDDLETLDVEQLDEQEIDEGLDGETPDDDQGQDEYFLSVNDRTKYRTQEEAIKGFNSAAERIRNLSQYEDLVKQFGVRSPAELVPLLNKALKASEVEKASTSSKESKESDVFSDPNLSPKEKAALQWLQNSAQKLGYVPKKELEAVAAQLKKLEEKFGEQEQKNEDVQFNALVKEGRGYLKSFASEAKLAQNDELLNVIETVIADYITKNEEANKAFYEGGEALKGAVKSGFDYAVRVLNLGKATERKNISTKKTTAMQTNPKQVPRSGKPGMGQERRVAPKGITTSTHDKAWALLNEKFGE